MIDRIRSLFGARSESEAEDGHSERQKHFAAAVLMIEAARLDGSFDESERRTVSALIESHFDVRGDEADTLIAAAMAAQDEANHLLRFTRAIKDMFSPEERVQVIEMLWEVAYADGVLHPYEANLLRRIGGLIYVSDRDRGLARKRVLDRLGVVEEAEQV